MFPVCIATRSSVLRLRIVPKRLPLPGSFAVSSLHPQLRRGRIALYSCGDTTAMIVLPQHLHVGGT
jgi:hypothetical protein